MQHPRILVVQSDKVWEPTPSGHDLKRVDTEGADSGQTKVSLTEWRGRKEGRQQGIETGSTHGSGQRIQGCGLRVAKGPGSQDHFTSGVRTVRPSSG